MALEVADALADLGAGAGRSGPGRRCRCRMVMRPLGGQGREREQLVEVEQFGRAGQRGDQRGCRRGGLTRGEGLDAELGGDGEGGRGEHVPEEPAASDAGFAPPGRAAVPGAARVVVVPRGVPPRHSVCPFAMNPACYCRVFSVATIIAHTRDGGEPFDVDVLWGTSHADAVAATPSGSVTAPS
ncbi:hypothetical protein STANM309S_00798 [Streptomyces tanashiensis]